MKKASVIAAALAALLAGSAAHAAETKVSIGISGWTGFAPLTLAKEAGIFKKHGLDVSIVAEGVETQEQLGFLAEEGCDAVQGYFIGKPAPIGQYAALVGRTPQTPDMTSRKAG